MKLKQDYKDVTLKEFINMCCIAKQRIVRLVDYHTDELLQEDINVEQLDDKYANYFIEYLHMQPFKDSRSGLFIDAVMILTIRGE